MEIKTDERGQYYESKYDRKVICNIVLKSDGVFHTLHSEEIPGLYVGGENIDDVFADFMNVWRALKEHVPQQVPALP